MHPSNPAALGTSQSIPIRGLISRVHIRGSSLTVYYHYLQHEACGGSCPSVKGSHQKARLSQTQNKLQINPSQKHQGEEKFATRGAPSTVVKEGLQRGGRAGGPGGASRC